MVVVSSSEGTSRERVGRHGWVTFRMMWNMSREGFRELYDALPDHKPKMLEMLYEEGWRFGCVVYDLVTARGLTRIFVRGWRDHLERAVKDPDYLWFGPDEAEPVEPCGLPSTSEASGLLV